MNDSVETIYNITQTLKNKGKINIKNIKYIKRNISSKNANAKGFMLLNPL